MSDRQSSLSPGDLKLLMGNFQNIIQMSTILVEQQKQLLESQQRVIGNQDGINTNQNEAYKQLMTMTNKLSECADHLDETNESMKNLFSTLQTTISNDLSTITGKLNTASTKHITWEKDVAKQHTAINKNVYVAWVGMGTLVLGLIGLLITAYERSDILKDIFEIVKEISQYFHLG